MIDHVSQLTDELRAGVSSLNNPHEQVRDVILQQLGCNLLNCVSDVNFSVASFIYSHLVEEFMLALDADLTFLVSNAYSYFVPVIPGQVLFSVGYKIKITGLDGMGMF